MRQENSHPVSLVEQCLGSYTHATDTPDWTHSLDNPYLHGVYAPTTQIGTSANKLDVIGELPHDLQGALFRNGPNPQHKPFNRYHPFDGDGMIHAIYVQDGQVSYKNKLIETACLQAENKAGQSLWPGVMGPFDFSLPDFPIKDTANTDVLVHNKKLVSLWYNSGLPYEMNPLTLENNGAYPHPSQLTRKMSAHAKVDWATGELFFFDYGDEPPYMTYGVLDANGKLKHEAAIDLPGPRLPHELAFTEHYAILHDHPLFHDVNVLRRHKMRLLEFHRDMPTRFGLIPRLGDTVTWFECEPCYVLHTSNAWEQGDWVIMDGCRSVNPMPEAKPHEGELSHMLSYMRLEANNYRWQFNRRTGEVKEGAIDDLNSEFNKANPIFQGVKGRYAYHQSVPLYEQGGATLRFTALLKYDNDTGKRSTYNYGEGVFGNEAVFAPKTNANRDSQEDDGYLVNIVTDAKDWSSWFYVFDAKDIEPGPIAKVKLPHRVPFGFHAHWANTQQISA